MKFSSFLYQKQFPGQLFLPFDWIIVGASATAAGFPALSFVLQYANRLLMELYEPEISCNFFPIPYLIFSLFRFLIVSLSFSTWF